jgi:hypothetical protein
MSQSDLLRSDQIASEAAQCTEKLVSGGMPRDEAWNVVEIEINNTLPKLELTFSEMRRLTKHD